MSTPYEDVREIMPDGTMLPIERGNETLTETWAATHPNQHDLTAPATMTAFDPYADEGDEADDQPPSRWRNPLVWVTIAVVAVVVFAAIFFVTRPKSTPLAYSTSSVAQGNLSVTVSATGPISSGTYNLNFSGSGTVTAIDVAVGQQVTAGQVLAKIDPTSLQDALNSAQQQLKSAQASYNAALVSLQDAENSQGAADAQAQDTYNNATNPASGPTPTAAQVQQATDQLNQAHINAQNSVNGAQSQVNSAAIQVQSAQLSVTTAQHNLSGATLTAPIAGEIASVNGNVGAASSGGSSSGGGSGSSSASSAFIQLVNLSSMQLTGQVNEADIGSVNVGWPVSFTVQAFPLDTFHGTVVSISPIGQTTSSVVTYPVTVAIDLQSAKQARLFPGMTASMTITTQQAIGVTLVPNTAITYARTAVRNGHLTTANVQTALAAAQQMIAGSTDLSSGTAGYVAEEKGSSLVAVPIVTGITDGTDTVALAGINPGDTVVTGDNQATTTTTSSSTSGTNIFGGGGRSGGGRGGAGGGNGG